MRRASTTTRRSCRPPPPRSSATSRRGPARSCRSSGGGSNSAGEELGEDFFGLLVAEDTAWAVVEGLGDRGELLGVVGDDGAFGQVFADPPVGAFVRAAFPGGVWVGEEHVDVRGE